MGQDRDETFKQLTKLLADPQVKMLEIENNKYVIISDTHLGDGGGADDFRGNQSALMKALDHYRRMNFTLILLGDVEELWQFDLQKIVEKYDATVYQKIREFGDSRVLRVFGNHDSEWRILEDPARQSRPRIGAAEEALKLVDKNSKTVALLVHGHQGSTESDKTSWFSRAVVRGYKFIESFIKFDPHTSSAKSVIAKEYERIFYQWGKENKIIVFCGHSHRAIFASLSRVERLENEKNSLQAQIPRALDDQETQKKLIKKLENVWQELLDERRKGRDIDPAPMAHLCPAISTVAAGYILTALRR